MQLTIDQTQEIIKNGKRVEQDFSSLRTNFELFRKQYFMEKPARPKNAEVDADDWKITPSPSSRNEVQGHKRLLDTSEIGVNMMENNQPSRNSDKIERGLKRVVEVSGEGRRARVLSDAALAVSLYGPCILAADMYSDMLMAKNLTPYMRRHYEKQEKKSPAVITVLNAEECSYEFEAGVLLLFQRKYKLRGNQLRARFGELPGKPIKDTNEYIVRDIYTPEYRVIDVENYGTVMSKEHGLTCIPIGIGFSGGSELFFKPEEQINPFLYAKAKAELWEWETSLLTAARTNANMRGLLGPMVHIEGEEDASITHSGGMRIMRSKGKATPIDDKIVDPVIFQLLNTVEDLSGQSTIYRQTLGENINAGTFSSLAMLSSAGKLPLIDPQRALQQAFEEVFDYILYRIKTDGIENEIIPPADIPDNYELSVEFKPKLPQDDLRNAQVAGMIGDKVSDEWIHTNLLQIGDSAAMQKQIVKEQVMKAMVQAMLQDQQFLGGMIAQIMGQGKQPAQVQGQTQPGAQPAMPQGQPMPQPQGQPNMEQTPLTDPMIPAQERM